MQSPQSIVLTRGRSFFHFALDPRKEIQCLHRWTDMTLPNHVDRILNSLNSHRAELTHVAEAELDIVRQQR